ncbi:hypothetical protein PC120_g15380 [Phytophthora cactorum]|nr:hypothetical protein PC120_g15380 [Phytophthora cactorum]
MKKTVDGTIRKYYSSEQFTFLQAYFTWDRLYDEMREFVELSRIRRREPGNSTMRKMLSLHCLNIRIRSPRDNVCDVCSIYMTKMRHGGATLDTTEELGRHTETARRMRLEYKGDLKAASDTHAVLVMDFSQNLTCPSISDTPSMWYFLSLLSISGFEIDYANDAKQCKYIYDERVSGKATDQVNPLMHDFPEKNAIPRHIRRLTVYADRCGGQNKSNHVIHFFLALVRQGLLDMVDFKFFVCEHTKNACDRGFGQIRNRMGRVDCWTVDDVVKNVAAAGNSSVVKRVTVEDNIFRDFKTVIQTTKCCAVPHLLCE